jgi:16S rRNA (cytidine1402-2'-O)-methyltransferase
MLGHGAGGVKRRPGHEKIPRGMAAGTLYVVATPLGNLEDMTIRAIRVLKDVALIACEDTRRTAKLLKAHGISTPTTSYFEHNEKWKGGRILERLLEGASVALVSDAGTPGISDPGFRLVRDARTQGLPVVPVPGPSAAVAALSVSGLPTDRFLFVGFLPSRSGPRQRAAADLVGRQETLVFYESPQRVLALIQDLRATFGDRDAFLCREATKVHEEYTRGPLSVLQALIEERGQVRGEIVLVVAGAKGATPAGDPMESVVEAFERVAKGGQTRRGAVKEVARALGLPAREVYRQVQQAQDDGSLPGENEE